MIAAVLSLLLAIGAPADAYAPAVRLEVDQTAGMDACAEMSYYRQQAGLPERFDRIGWRESRCTNTPISRTGCCVGFWQLHKVIFRDHRMVDGLDVCGATWWNVRGDSVGAKRRQACAAKVLFDVDGFKPWRL